MVPPKKRDDLDDARGAHTPVRARLLKAATELFYREGIRSVGVDTVIAEAKVAKASLYRWFPSKDELIAAALEETYRPFWEWWDRVLARTPNDPEQQLRNLLRGLVRQLDSPNYRGCPSLNATSELAEFDHPGRVQCRRNKAETRRRLEALASALHAESAARLANQLMLLIDGAYASAHVLGPAGAHHELEAAAMAVVAASRPSRARRETGSR